MCNGLNLYTSMKFAKKRDSLCDTFSNSIMSENIQNVCRFQDDCQNNLLHPVSMVDSNKTYM